MAGLLELLSGDRGQEILSGVSRQTGHTTDQVGSVLAMALPILLGAMKKNATTPQGAQGLLGALSSNSHDGSILDNLAGLFSGGVDQSVMQDGAGILGHILGGKQAQVENALSSRSGLDTGSIGTILKIAAPLLLGFLGQKTRQNRVSNSSGIESLLSSVMGGGNVANEQQSLIESFLDADGDGSILDDVASIALGGKRGGIGGLLGGLFGK